MLDEIGNQTKEMFHLTSHSTHFIYGYMASDHSEATPCRHMGFSFRLAAIVILYAASHRQDNTYHGLGYTSHGTLAGTRISSMGQPHKGSIRRPIAPSANVHTTELHLAPKPERKRERERERERCFI